MMKNDAIAIPVNLSRAIEKEAARRSELPNATILRVLFDHFEAEIRESEKYALPMPMFEEEAS